MDVLEPLDGNNWRWSEWTDWATATELDDLKREWPAAPDA